MSTRSPVHSRNISRILPEALEVIALLAVDQRKDHLSCTELLRVSRQVIVDISELGRRLFG